MILPTHRSILINEEFVKIHGILYTKIKSHSHNMYSYLQNLMTRAHCIDHTYHAHSALIVAKEWSRGRSFDSIPLQELVLNISISVMEIINIITQI